MTKKNTDFYLDFYDDIQTPPIREEEREKHSNSCTQNNQNEEYQGTNNVSVLDIFDDDFDHSLSPILGRQSCFPILVGDKGSAPYGIPPTLNLIDRKIQNRRAMCSPFYFNFPYSEKSTNSEINTTALIFRASYSIEPMLVCTRRFEYRLNEINGEHLYKNNIFYDKVVPVVGEIDRRTNILPCMLRISHSEVELNLVSRYGETWGLHRVQQASISAGGFRPQMDNCPGEYIHLFSTPPPPHDCFMSSDPKDKNSMIIRQHIRSGMFLRLYESKVNLIQVYGSPTTIPSTQYICLSQKDKDVLDSCNFKNRVYGVNPVDNPRDLNLLLNKGAELYIVDSAYLNAQCLKLYGYHPEDIFWMPQTRDEIRTKIKAGFSGEGRMDVDRFLDFSLVNIRNLFSDSGFNLLFVSLPSGSILKLTPAFVLTLVLKHRQNEFTLVN